MTTYNWKFKKRESDRRFIAEYQLFKDERLIKAYRDITKAQKAEAARRYNGHIFLNSIRDFK